MTTLNRLLVLMIDGAPLNWGTTNSEIRELVGEYPDDEADRFQVWSVPSPARRSKAEDVTQAFAASWAADCVQAESPAPAFVREHFSREPELATAADASHVPNPLRRVS